MINSIIISFEEIIGSWESMIELSDKQFEAIENKDSKTFETLHKQENLLRFDLQKSLIRLKEEVEKASKYFNKSGNVISELYDVMEKEQMEKLMAYQRCAINCERKLTNNLKRNERQILSNLSILEILQDSFAHIVKEENVNGSVMINKKY